HRLHDPRRPIARGPRLMRHATRDLNPERVAVETEIGITQGIYQRPNRGVPRATEIVRNERLDYFEGETRWSGKLAIAHAHRDQRAPQHPRQRGDREGTIVT